MNLSLIANVLIICLGLLEAVSSTPKLHKASDGQEYLIDADPQYNWHQAWHACTRRGFQLVVIDSAVKNAIIINLLKMIKERPDDLWIGSNDEFSSRPDLRRPFFWSATGEQLNFTNWADNNPNNCKGRQHCVHIKTERCVYKWNDDVCTYQKGFICEVNHFKKTCNNDLKHKCDVVKSITELISDEFDQVLNQQLNEIDSKFKNIEYTVNNRTEQIEQLQISSQMTIQNILDEQQKTVEQLTEKILQQVNKLNVEMKSSTADISAQFGEKLSEKQNEINTIC